ncbi:FAD-dependent oxidoreductase [Desulfovibrio inopinatus]|uniref:FAD-dependent oxidoreductase n=1 Tax=Desulfovibrio inopinatus TaxID=102109 RepID=UPI00041A1407|nr:FAD-dependent oxidoreductase [Desulfovibrio inopinatus]
MIRHDVIIVGAGPAGLSAAIEAARRGLDVVVFDENAKPGGQLFKQIHKFFGSKEHKAKVRGFKIGEDLLREAKEAGVRVVLGAIVTGLYLDREVTVQINDHIEHYKGDAIIVATGASENMIPFEGWTLPGVIGAGAAQTMMNLHNIKPGNRMLMLGSGNVGLVVSFQLLQAGCELVAVVDAAPRIGGYGVHAAKVARCGVPFLQSHTIVKAHGTDCVTGVTVAQIGSDWKPIPGTEKYFDVDTICLAVGLSPMCQLLKMAGCDMKDTPLGYVPEVDANGSTSVPGIFAAGDVSGIEEASSAMIEGRIAGVAAAAYLGFIDEEALEHSIEDFEKALGCLREGMFAPENRGKAIQATSEGIPVSNSLLTKGYLLEDELKRFPGATPPRHSGVRPVIECTQNIPCNPCQDACKKHCITIGEKITALPAIDENHPCTGCGMCVASCSGQAIFLVDESMEDGSATVTVPYEFLPLPAPGTHGKGLDRSGSPVCDAEIVDVKSIKAFDHTHLVTMRVPADMAMTARFFRSQE